MNKVLREYGKRFDAQSIRERALVGIAVFALIGFCWWNYYAIPMQQSIDAENERNERVARQVDETRVVIAQIRQRIAAGVYQKKDSQLRQLRAELDAVETRLQEETVELIDPDMMLQLMTQLIYRDSRLKVLSLQRREVRLALPVEEDQPDDAPRIYRHVLEVELSGKYLDMLSYMQTLEQLDWKLLWDEIEVLGEDYPTVTLRLVISTLSTRRHWISI